MLTPTQECDLKLLRDSHAVSYIGVQHSFFASALEQGRCNGEPLTPHGSLVGLSPSSSLVVSPLMSILGALGGGIRTAGSAFAFALGSSTIEGALGGGMLGKVPKPIA